MMFLRREFIAFVLFVALTAPYSTVVAASITTVTRADVKEPVSRTIAMLPTPSTRPAPPIGVGGPTLAAMRLAYPVHPPTLEQMLAARTNAVLGRSLGHGLPVHPSLGLGTILSPSEASQQRRSPPARGAAAIMVTTHGRTVRRTRSNEIVIGSTNSSGITPWWTFEERPIPGLGRSLVNINTANLIVQSTDIQIPERGLNLVFERTYNFVSGHDYAMSDGSAQPAQYGAGWTNTFDAHLATNTAGISVFDDVGTRYDYYGAIANGCMTPPPGQHSSLCFNGSGYYWTRPDGVVLSFYRPDLATVAGYTALAAYAGRLYEVSGRNNNNTLTLTYAWINGDSTNAANLTSIVVKHSDGQSLTLNFAAFGQQTLLQSVVRPDGQAVTYTYDSSGNLSNVNGIPNGSNGNAALVQSYGWYANHQLNYADGPRWNASNGTDGGYQFYSYSSTDTGIAYTADAGFMDPTPADGTNTPLQPAPQGFSHGQIDYFTFVAGATYLRDTDGHQTNWTLDGNGRTWTADQFASGSTWLRTTNQTWDVNNNLIATDDPRGNETDYAYDANGNTIAVAEPAPSSGQTRPLKLFSYDTDNNVTAYCDPVVNGTTRLWSSTYQSAPTDSECPANTGERFSYGYPKDEPYGELYDTYTALGYHTHYEYTLASEGGSAEYGLPTGIIGDAISQKDGTTRTPTQSFTYDVNGNLIQYNKGNGNWKLMYDTLGRVISRSDPDGVLMTTSYFPNGSVASTQSAAEHAAGVSTTYTYDLDGDQLTQTDFETTTAATTTKWYDGADRLIEVQKPQDSRDFYSFAWKTRYLYDLTANGTVGTVSFATSPTYSAYGNLFKTQEYLPTVGPSWSETTSTGNLSGTWQDTAGTVFDALDRSVVLYRNTGSGLQPEQQTYDASASTLDLLSSKCNANNECGTMSYDTLGRLTATTYNVSSSPAESFSYDLDSRMTSASSANGSIADAYDLDGRKTSRAESPNLTPGFTSTISYHYYSDGTRSSLDIVVPGSTISSALSYSYRTDDLIQKLVVEGDAFNFVYTSAGRLTSRSDATGQSAYTESYAPTTGLVTSINTQNWRETGLTYSPEGKQLGGSAQYYNGSGWYGTSIGSYSNVYTTRGELADSNGDTGIAYANGTRFNTLKSSGVSGSPKNAAFQFNQFLGFPMSVTTRNTCTSNCGVSLTNAVSTGYGYDVVGRLTSLSHSSLSDSANAWTDTKKYDADDHLLSEFLPELAPGGGKSGAFYMGTLGYVWGPIGHPFEIGSTSLVLNNGANKPTADFQYDRLFWDDDDLLFSLNSSAKIDDIKISDFADYVPGAKYPLMVWDRDSNGQLAACHNSVGTGLASATAFQHFQTPVACVGILGATTATFATIPALAYPATTVGRGAIVIEPKADGFSDGLNTFQGVRVYDTQAGVWSSPDAYRGQVHDPATQKPYIWEGNNPLVYSDPSGYCLEDACILEGGAAIGTLDVLAAVSGALGATALSNWSSSTSSHITGALLAAGRSFGGALLQNDGAQIDEGQQGKHVPGHNNFDPERGRSELDHPDPQGLVDGHAGTGQQVGPVSIGQPGSKERIDFGETIGTHIDPSTGTRTPTTKGIIHYGRKGVHIVPARQ